MTVVQAKGSRAMLRNIKEIKGYRVLATDGAIGKVSDFFFDDISWLVRYVVIETGGLLSSERVLVSPTAVGVPRWEERIVPVELSQKAIEVGPNPLDDPPVSRRKEIELARHYGWPAYWDEPVAPPLETAEAPTVPGDPHLRSADEVIGYHIDAVDEEFGHVEDLIVDVDHWQITYLVIDTKNWLPGKKVLVSPGAASRFDWGARNVHVDLSRDEIEDCPEYDPTAPVNREWRALVTDVAGRPA
jgi:hypothetical protein